MTKKIYRRKLIIGCTSSEHPPAAEVIAGNDDLLKEILFRVPAKSLIRFKGVSKHWLSFLNSLFTDSQFTSNHAGRNHRSSISGLYFNYCGQKNLVESVSLDGNPSLPTLAFLDGVVAGSTTKIAHSCNGLMLCSMLSSNSYGKPPLRYIVCNPTTKKYNVLPEPNGTSSSALYLHHVGAFLAFDPSNSPHHKVLLFSYIYANSGFCYQIEIYCSESSSWKHIRVAAPRGDPFRFKVFWNGAIHCISYKNFHIRFEVEAEKLKSTPMPPYPRILSSNKIWYFGECGDHLLLIQTSQSSAMRFRILEMDRKYSGWIVKYSVNLKPILSVFSAITRSCACNVLCVVKEANGKDFTLVLAIPGKVISYNLKARHGRCFVIFGQVIFEAGK